MSDKSYQNVEAVVQSTLRKHGAKLQQVKIDPKEKESLKKVTINLKKSVEEVLKGTKEKTE